LSFYQPVTTILKSPEEMLAPLIVMVTVFTLVRILSAMTKPPVKVSKT